jgi:MoaA/NifB/PqqE/SkfB family radical SAM enzyme
MEKAENNPESQSATVDPSLREPLPWPILAHWDITYGCNFRCSFCLSASGCPLDHEFSTTEAKATIDKLYDAGVVFLRVLGGEPFFRKDTLEIFRHAVDRGLLFSFSTNASLVTPDRARQLSEFGDALRYLQVSLYGSDEESYARTTHSTQSFERVKQGIRMLTGEGLEVTVMVVATPQNVDQAVRYFAIAEEVGAAEVRLAPVVAMGRKADEEFKLEEAVDLYVRMVRQANRIQASRTASSPRFLVEARPLLGAFLRTMGSFEIYWQNCLAGISMIFLDPSGKVAPCPFVHNLPKNLQEQYQFLLPQEMQGRTIEEIWRSPAFKELRRFHDPRQNAYPVETNCRFYKTGDCVPCALTPCGCKRLIREIRRAMRISGSENGPVEDVPNGAMASAE